MQHKRESSTVNILTKVAKKGFTGTAEGLVAYGGVAGTLMNVLESLNFDPENSTVYSLTAGSSFLAVYALANIIGACSGHDKAQHFMQVAAAVFSNMNLTVQLVNFFSAEIIDITHSDPNITGIKGWILFGSTLALAIGLSIAPEIRRYFLEQHKHPGLLDQKHFIDRRGNFGKTADFGNEFIVGASNGAGVLNTLANIVGLTYRSPITRALNWTGVAAGGLFRGLRTVSPNWIHARVNKGKSPNWINHTEDGENAVVAASYAAGIGTTINSLPTPTNWIQGVIAAVLYLLNLGILLTSECTSRCKDERNTDPERLINTRRTATVISTYDVSSSEGEEDEEEEEETYVEEAYEEEESEDEEKEHDKKPMDHQNNTARTDNDPQQPALPTTAFARSNSVESFFGAKHDNPGNPDSITRSNSADNLVKTHGGTP